MREKEFLAASKCIQTATEKLEEYIEFKNQPLRPHHTQDIILQEVIMYSNLAIMWQLAARDET